MLHAELSEAALRRGKHVLQEKPTALTLAEGERVRAAAEQSGRVFGIVHNFQFARSTLKLQRLLAEGRLGEVFSINAFQSSSPLRRLPEWSEELPLGLFCDESPHFFYLFRAFGGHTEITDVVVKRSRRKPATPHLVTAHLDTELAPAFLYCSFESSVSEWYFMLICERAVAVIDIFRDLLIVAPHDKTHLAPDMMRTSLAGTWQHWLGVARSGSLHMAKRLSYGMDEVVRRFLDGVETGTEPQGVGLTDALEVLRLQQDVVARSEQEVVARGEGPEAAVCRPRRRLRRPLPAARGRRGAVHAEPLGPPGGARVGRAGGDGRRGGAGARVERLAAGHARACAWPCSRPPRSWTGACRCRGRRTELATLLRRLLRGPAGRGGQQHPVLPDVVAGRRAGAVRAAASAAHRARLGCGATRKLAPPTR